ncbi:MAG TPA: PAS domain S-box protein [Cyclobacteriaceae bacterium]|nr:PAS domain S-box protein [Cyclobacteriaceae bacterium]
MMVPKQYVPDIFTTSPMPMWMIDSTGHLLKVNKTARQLFGFTTLEWKNNEALGLFKRNKKNSFKAEIKLKTGKKIALQFYKQTSIVNRNKIVIITGHKISALQGKRKLTGQLLDVQTDRQKFSRALEEKDTIILSILDSITDGFFVLDANWNFKLVNSVFCKLAGHSVDTLLNKNIWEVFPQLQSMEANKAYRLAMKKKEAVHFETVDFNNPEIKLEVHAYPMDSGLFIYYQDITDRKQVVYEIEASRKKFEHLINTVDGIVWEADAKTLTLNFVSDQAEKILGYPISEWTTDPDFWIKHVHPQDRERAYSHCIEAIRNKQDYQIVYRMIAADNRTVWLKENISIILKDNEPDRLTGLTVDVTSMRRTEEEFKKLSFIAQHTGHAVVFFDTDETITWVNEGFEKVTGYSSNELIGKKIFSSLQGSEMDVEKHDYVRRKIASGEGFKTEIIRYAKSGEKHWFDVEVKPLKNEMNEVTGFMAIESDITNLKKVITALMDNDEQLSSITNNSPLLFYTKDMNGRYRFVSEKFKKRNGQHEPLEGKTVFDVFDKDLAALCSSKDREVVQTDETIIFEYSQGDKFFIETKFPIHDSKGSIVLVGGQILDVTENYKMRKLLDEKESQVRLLSDNIPNGFIYQLSINNNKIRDFSFCSSGISSIIGISAARVKNDAMNFFKRVHRRDVSKLLMVETSSMDDLTVFDLEFRILNATMEYRWLYTRAKPKRLDKDTIIWDGYAIDITERKKSEVALVASNHEKDILLREIHHRVKNSLQMVSSMMFLKINSLEDGKEKDFLVDMRERIKSISLIHERLLHTNKVNSIDICDYLTKLLDDIQVSNYKVNLSLTINRTIESIWLPSDVAIYCGLIINELVTNSIKHAFPNRSEGIIHISVQSQIPNILVIVVEDDGVGIPLRDIGSKPQSLGMLLLEIFVKQINGNMNILTQKGSKFSIRCELLKNLSLI